MIDACIENIQPNTFNSNVKSERFTTYKKIVKSENVAIYKYACLVSNEAVFGMGVGTYLSIF